MPAANLRTLVMPAATPEGLEDAGDKVEDGGGSAVGRGELGGRSREGGP